MLGKYAQPTIFVTIKQKIYLYSKIFFTIFIFLEYSLEKLVKEEQRDKLNKKARAELDDIVNSLLTQDSLEAPKKKTFFENLFGWLK